MKPSAWRYIWTFEISGYFVYAINFELSMYYTITSWSSLDSAAPGEMHVFYACGLFLLLSALVKSNDKGECCSFYLWLETTTSWMSDNLHNVILKKKRNLFVPFRTLQSSRHSWITPGYKDRYTIVTHTAWTRASSQIHFLISAP